MSIESRIRGLVGPERAASLGISEPARTPQQPTAADLATATADVEAWRQYRDEPDAFARMRLRMARGAAIERGRNTDENL
jgi:hypothetical protein